MSRVKQGKSQGAARRGKGAKAQDRRVQDRPSASSLAVRRLRRLAKPAALLLVAAGVIAAAPKLLHFAGRSAAAIHHGAAGALAEAGFRVEHIEIVGAHDVPKARILRALDVKHGTPILDVSVSGAAARVGALGAVKQVAIERLLPDTLRVKVSERAPIAIWQTPHDRFALVGAGGAILARRDAGAAKAREPGLKLIVGAGAPAHADALFALLRKHPAIEKRVVASVRVDHLRWNLILKDHTTIKLPSQHVAAALDRLETAQRKIALLDRPVASIDLRLADRLVVRPYPGTLRHPGEGADPPRGDRSS